MISIPVHSRLDADESASFLTAKIKLEEPFLYLRYGDGAIECIYDLGQGRTCDNEFYSKQLGMDLAAAWNKIKVGTNVYIGDWFSASFYDFKATYIAQYEELIGTAPLKFIHFEALLLLKESKATFEFYRAVAKSKQRKLLVGPGCMAKAAVMLGAQHLEVPMGGLHKFVPALEKQLLQSDFDILLWGAGMAFSIPVVTCWEKYPERTYVNYGSGLDPLFRGRTRTQQIDQKAARRIFNELL